MEWLLLTPWHWLALAVLLGIIDLIVGANFVLLWMGAVAGLVSLVLALYPALSWQWQLLLFSVGVAASLLWWWRFGKSMQKNKTDKPFLNQRAARLIHREVILEEPISMGRGRVLIDGAVWTVTGPDCPKGAQVKIVQVEGALLHVLPVTADH